MLCYYHKAGNKHTSLICEVKVAASSYSEGEGLHDTTDANSLTKIGRPRIIFILSIVIFPLTIFINFKVRNTQRSN